jgi:octaprenyl-diphosphate synthase
MGRLCAMTNPSPLVRKAVPNLGRIQAPVRDRLDQVLQEIRRIVSADFDMIEAVNDHLLLQPGKLFRPTLVLLSNEIGGSPRSHAVTFGAAVELVHLATLVHDDAVDNSVLRRGQPTVNALWTHQIAIIMGDYLYSRALTELAESGHLEAIKILGSAANAMSVGEMRQLTAYDRLEFSEDDYYRLIAAKTASLMSAACAMGALAGGQHHREAFQRFGHNLGMAFQVADDILDYVGAEEETGKPVGQDLRERKVTLPLVGALKTATPPRRRRSVGSSRVLMPQRRRSSGSFDWWRSSEGSRMPGGRHGSSRRRRKRPLENTARPGRDSGCSPGFHHLCRRQESLSGCRP